MVLSKISTFGFDFGIWPGAKSFLVFGLRLRPNVKMHLWSFTVSQNKSIAYFSPKFLDKPLILAVSCISQKTFLLKKKWCTVRMYMMYFSQSYTYTYVSMRYVIFTIFLLSKIQCIQAVLCLHDSLATWFSK